MTPDDLFPHATAKAPALVSARRALDKTLDDLAYAQQNGAPESEIVTLEACAYRMNQTLEQLEAEAMRKEGR